jgi:hypothetical protein
VLRRAGRADRIEALPRVAREDAIARLLGLERLVSVERELKPTAEEEAALKHARADLALVERWRASREAGAQRRRSPACWRRRVCACWSRNAMRLLRGRPGT